jgi:MinD superfamily P-loop ATPase
LKQLVILSGKGGTGKTTVAAALAHLASQEMSIVMADADVDAANLELLLDPVRLEAHPFVGGKVAVVAAEVCSACGICQDVCRFGAIGRDHIDGAGAYRVDGIACEGCAACFYQCPDEAIQMVEQQAGMWFRSDTRHGPLFHAHLFAAQENSGKLVTLVKQQARLRGLDAAAALLLVDGPPGIGCPVIAAAAGADIALHVVEPTVSGVHDLGRIMATTDHFGVPSMVAINKADLNPGRSGEVAEFCAASGADLVGYVPYDTVVTEAMVHAQPVTAYANGPVTEALEAVWKRVKGHLGL